MSSVFSTYISPSVLIEAEKYLTEYYCCYSGSNFTIGNMKTPMPWDDRFFCKSYIMKNMGKIIKYFKSYLYSLPIIGHTVNMYENIDEYYEEVQRITNYVHSVIANKNVTEKINRRIVNNIKYILEARGKYLLTRLMGNIGQNQKYDTIYEIRNEISFWLYTSILYFTILSDIIEKDYAYIKLISNIITLTSRLDNEQNIYTEVPFYMYSIFLKYKDLITILYEALRKMFFHYNCSYTESIIRLDFNRDLSIEEMFNKLYKPHLINLNSIDDINNKTTLISKIAKNYSDFAKLQSYKVLDYALRYVYKEEEKTKILTWLLLNLPLGKKPYKTTMLMISNLLSLIAVHHDCDISMLKAIKQSKFHKAKMLCKLRDKQTTSKELLNILSRRWQFPEYILVSVLLHPNCPKELHLSILTQHNTDFIKYKIPIIGYLMRVTEVNELEQNNKINSICSKLVNNEYVQY